MLYRLLIVAALAAVVSTAVAKIQPAEAQTTSQRLRKLELGNTERQKTLVRKVSKEYHRSRGVQTRSCLEGEGKGYRECQEPKASARAGTCTGDAVQVTFGSGAALPSASHAWLTASVQFAGNPVSVFVNWTSTSGGNCSATRSASGSGTVAIDKFCTFSIDANANYTMRFGVGNGDPCTKIVAIDAELKLTNVQMIEPE